MNKNNVPQTEAECREQWMRETRDLTLDTLPAFLEKLAAYPHDYGTICVALGAAAVAACRAMDRSDTGGITGFQAGAVFWEFAREWKGIKSARLLDYEDLLYPQHGYRFTTITPETWATCQQAARENLTKNMDHVHPDVWEHWVSIADGELPFGLTVKQ